ncbi:histidine kinase [Chitinophaga polysaccharea]|uniref:tetratricopeptide repeat-containing sensor histidine kinase n=1 Tax=Chitinophaga polysaccharea TaxID=1293035 RepID=UPI00145526B4|nr:histidine kinase [Chitinophaga polysaccharea]NLR60632.1 histidine kinase [Chitinophaga polysaccharea]
MINFRIILLAGLLFCCLLSCRQQGSQTRTHDTNVIANSPVVDSLKQWIDSVDRSTTPATRKKVESLYAAAMAGGERAQGYYYYLIGKLQWQPDSNKAAIASFLRMLPPGSIDTTRMTDLYLLQQMALLRLDLKKKIDDSTFARIYQLLDIAARFHYPDIFRVYDLAAEIHFRYGVYDKAKLYTDKATASYPNPDDNYYHSYLMEAQSRIAERQHNYPLALRYEDSALVLALRQPDSLRIATVYSALGVLYEKMGQQAKGHALMIQAFHIKERENKVSFREYVNYGQMFMEEAQYAPAVFYLQKAVDMARTPTNASNLSSAYNTLYTIYYQSGDYKKAVLYLDSASNMALTALEEEQLKKVMELQALNELKEQQHKTLDISRQYNNQTIILRQQRVILLILGILMIAGVSLGLVLIRQRKLKTQQHHMALEQRLLRSQMEPHFIFNTLAVLQSFIRHDEKEKAVKYLNKFARLLRLNLDNSRHNLVQLHQEVEALENYLSLQTIRFGNIFDYAIHPIEGCEEMDILIPPMLMQPFVENAIQHGMRNLAYKGHISVQLQLHNDLLHCVIEDNGHGLAASSSAGKHSLSGIITRERLKILSKETGKLASIVVSDKQEKGEHGVKVTLIIPTQREK